MSTIALDFDGVIHVDTGEWKGVGVIEGPVVPGAREGVAAIRAAGFRVSVYSCRTRDPGGREAIVAWLKAQDIAVDDVEIKKPMAKLYVDDHGFRFQGSWSSVIAFIKTDDLSSWQGSAGN